MNFSVLTFHVSETDPIKYFTFSMIISILGIRGILLNRRNILIMSMPIESMLLAVNLNFLVFSISLDDMMGQSFALLVLTVAAAESAIGLAIFVITFRVRGTIAVESINCIQG
nr:NADH dehydrogenase subunit 4L [Georgeantha hexandra]